MRVLRSGEESAQGKTALTWVFWQTSHVESARWQSCPGCYCWLVHCRGPRQDGSQPEYGAWGHSCC